MLLTLEFVVILKQKLVLLHQTIYPDLCLLEEWHDLVETQLIVGVELWLVYLSRAQSVICLMRVYNISIAGCLTGPYLNWLRHLIFGKLLEALQLARREDLNAFSFD